MYFWGDIGLWTKGVVLARMGDMDTRVVIQIAGVRDGNGDIYTEETLREMAAQKSYLHFDERTGALMAHLRMELDRTDPYNITTVFTPVDW